MTHLSDMEINDMKDMKQETETTTEIVETEDERYTRLRKERLEWQKNHPNKW